jgi:MFS family permease
MTKSDIIEANIAGMREDLHTSTGNRYSILAMIFFVGYAVIDIPAMYLTRKLGPAFWLGSIGLFWSVITLSQGFVHHWVPLAVCRLLLGFLEGGLVPGVLYLLSCWYTRYEIGTRIAFFYVIGVASSGLSGLLAYGLEKMDGTADISGWRYVLCIMHAGWPELTGS